MRLPTHTKRRPVESDAGDGTFEVASVAAKPKPKRGRLDGDSEHARADWVRVRDSHGSRTVCDTVMLVERRRAAVAQHWRQTL